MVNYTSSASFANLSGLCVLIGSMKTQSPQRFAKSTKNCLDWLDLQEIELANRNEKSVISNFSFPISPS